MSGYKWSKLFNIAKPRGQDMCDFSWGKFFFFLKTVTDQRNVFVHVQPGEPVALLALLTRAQVTWAATSPERLAPASVTNRSSCIIGVPWTTFVQPHSWKVSSAAVTSEKGLVSLLSFLSFPLLPTRGWFSLVETARGQRLSSDPRRGCGVTGCTIHIVSLQTPRSKNCTT